MNANQYQALVVGAGFSGAVLAERFASQLGWRVLVIDQRAHIGGNCFDEYDAHGVFIHRYGPHLFHTDNEAVWQYLSRFTTWHPYEHRVLASIDGALVPIPFNLDSIERCFPAKDAAALIASLRERFGDGARVPILQLRKEADPKLHDLADFIYRKVFLNYTTKQWGVPPEEISPEVTARVPVVVSRDDRYFTDRFQAVPADGYAKTISNILKQDGIDVRLSTPFSEIATFDAATGDVTLFGKAFAGLTIFTGMIDELFGFARGELPYRSLSFDLQHLNQEQFQPATTVNYPNEQAYTRITEFKHLTAQICTGTTVAIEYPHAYSRAAGHTPYYPVFNQASQEAYRDYAARVAAFPRLVLAGRLAQYRYFDMDDAVANALDTFDALKGRLTS
ncbi:UDP-galactopyranose mutase [Niveibacterium sp.]|uniref:UDP-galactopyranose mutase n=1 Tax=Niveibacterium sp. TaxID=2017444 RepID=UPI0035ADCCCD